MEVEYFLGLTPNCQWSFEKLTDHLSLAFQSCKTVNSLSGNFYNWFQKLKETEDTFTDELQILMHQIVAQKLEFVGETNQALKHEYAFHLRDPCFRVVAQGQCLASPDSKSSSQFRDWLLFMFGSCCKCGKKVNATTAMVSSGEVSGGASDNIQEPLSCNFHMHQQEMNAKATDIATMKEDN